MTYFNMYTQKRPYGQLVEAAAYQQVAGLIEKTGKYVGLCPCCNRHPVILTAQGIEPTAEDRKTIE